MCSGVLYVVGSQPRPALLAVPEATACHATSVHAVAVDPDPAILSPNADLLIHRSRGLKGEHFQPLKIIRLELLFVCLITSLGGDLLCLIVIFLSLHPDKMSCTVVTSFLLGYYAH